MRLPWVLSLALSCSCGAGSSMAPPPNVPRAEPLPTAENQQGVPDPIAPAPTTTVSLPPSTVAAVAGVYLWCATPGGRACAAASAALGTGPKELSGLPTALLTVEDLPDDCLEPTILGVTRRLAPALAVGASGWRDQAGTYMDLSTLPDMYSAAGCINDVDPALPVAKISAASAGPPRLYLVRVWEQGTASY